MRALIEKLEATRGNPVLVLATRNVEMEILPALYDSLREYGSMKHLDVVLYCRGGVVNAARRIALLMHDVSSRLSFIVPHYCESSGTILALAAHEIIAGPTASFSPVDPHLQSDHRRQGEGGPDAISAENIRMFAKMCEDWFELSKPDAQSQALSALCASIFPATLTSFYRAALETRAVCLDLLERSVGYLPEEARTKIVDQLLFGYHSHTFSLAPEDLQALGLPIQRNNEVEAIAWEIAQNLRLSFAAALTQDEPDAWMNTIVATRLAIKRQYSGSGARWETGRAE